MENKVNQYNIIIPCPRHKNKAVEYVCTHNEQHTQNLYCTTCIFKREYCQHEDDIMDLNEFLNEQRQQFRRYGLNGAPEISEALDSKKEFLQHCKDQAQHQVEVIEQHFDNLITKIVDALNQTREETIKSLETYIERFAHLYKLLEGKVKQNFQTLFFTSKFRSFEEMVKNFMPFSFESVSLMTTALRENYALQGKVNNDITFTFQEVMSMQKNQPSFDLGKFGALETQLGNWIDELQKAAPSLLSTTINNNTLPVPLNNNLIPNEQSKSIPQQLQQQQPVVVRGMTPVKIRHNFGGGGSSLAPVNQSYTKLPVSSGVDDSFRKQQNGPKRSKSTARIQSGGPTGSTTTLPMISARDISPQKEVGQYAVENINIQHLKSIETSHTRSIFTLIYIGNRFVATGSDDGLIKIWHIDQNRCFYVLRGHKAGIRSLAVLESKNLVSASWDRTIKIWETSRLFDKKEVDDHIDREQAMQLGLEDYDPSELTINCLKTLKGHMNSVLCVGVLPDGIILMSGSSDNTVRLWDTENGMLLRSMFGHMNEVICLTASRFRPLIISGSGDKTIKVWNYRTKKSLSPCLMTLTGHTGFVWSVELLRDDSTLVSGSQDNLIRVWNIDNGECLKILVGHSSQVLSLKKFKNDIIASADGEGIIRFWNVQNGSLLAIVKANRDKYAINSLDVTEDLLLVSAGTDRKIGIHAHKYF